MKNTPNTTITGEENKKTPDWQELLPLLLLLALELFFWRNIILTDNMLGDLGDGRFTALVTEHWWRFFTGKERFGYIPIFYPNTTALGYSDLHLGFGIFHSLFRLFGMDLYLAFKYSVFMMHVLGVATMYILLRKSFRLKVIWSLFGTVAFSHCCALASVSNHPQLFAAGMLPLLLILFHGFVQNFGQRAKRNIYAYLCLFWFVLLTYTSWYMACFTGIFCLVFIIVYLILMGRKRVNMLKELQSWIGIMKLDIVGYLLFTVLLYLPFLSVYLPVLREGSLYVYSGTYLPSPIDLINVTEDNIMSGWLIRLLKLNARGRDPEVAQGFSLISLVMFILICVDLFSNSGKKAKLELVLPKTAALSVIICILLTIRWDNDKASLWALVYTLLPPVRAIHSVSRFLLWLCFPMSVITAFWADRMALFRSKEKGLLISCIIFALLIFSTARLHGLATAFTHADRREFMANIAEAPENAASFYLVDSAFSGDQPYVYQLDAYEIALQTGLPTLNGYSGHFPAGWGVWDVCGADYDAYALQWAQQHGLGNVCVYDRATNTWGFR